MLLICDISCFILSINYTISITFTESKGVIRIILLWGINSYYTLGLCHENLKVVSGTSFTGKDKAYPFSTSFTPSRDLSSVIIGGVRDGGVVSAEIRDSEGNTLASSNITGATMQYEGAISSVTQPNINIVSCDLKKDETYTFYVPANSVTGKWYFVYGFLIYE